MKLITEGMTANEAIDWLDTMKRRREPQRIEPTCAHSHLPGGLGCIVCESEAFERAKSLRNNQESPT